MPAQRTNTKKSDPQLGKPSSRLSAGSTSSLETDSTGDRLLGLDFTTRGRPAWDYRLEYGMDEMEENEELHE